MMKIMKDERFVFASLLSGGKDSNFAILKMYKETKRLPCCAITVKAKKDDYLFHYENTEWVGLQCESMNIPWIYVNSLEEGLKKAKDEYGANYLLTGGILSFYQKKKFEEIAGNFEIKVISPFWGNDQISYMLSLIDEGIRYMIVKVAALGLGREWLGKIIGLEETKEIINLSKKYRFNPTFEGGEAETFVLQTPIYRKRIVIDEHEIIWEKDSGSYIIKKAHLE